MKWPFPPPTDDLSPRQLARAHADLARVQTVEELLHVAASIREHAPDWAADLAASAAQRLAPAAALEAWQSVVDCLAPVPHYQQHLAALLEQLNTAQPLVPKPIPPTAPKAEAPSPERVATALRVAPQLLEHSIDTLQLIEVGRDLRHAEPDLALRLLQRATKLASEETLSALIRNHAEWGDPERAVWLAWGFHAAEAIGRDPDHWPSLEASFETVLEALCESLLALEDLESGAPNPDQLIRPLPEWPDLPPSPEDMGDDAQAGDDELPDREPSALRHPAMGAFSLEEHRRRVDELTNEGIDLECVCDWAHVHELLEFSDCACLFEGWSERRDVTRQVIDTLEFMAGRAGREEIAGGNVRRTLRWGVETGRIPAWLADQVARILTPNRSPCGD